MSSPSTRPDGRYRDGAGRILGRTIADAGGYLAQQADVPAAALALQTQFDRLSGAAQVEVMQSMAEVLDSMFEHLSDDEVPQSGLSASERAALAAIGADDGARGDAAPLRRNMARNAAMNAAIQASARPLAEIARMLELSDGRLRQRLA
ncbi:MAG: hypothetical protein NZ734_13850, partial [Paracoccus sp.]|nr:hypothetical protein [Paracoccus sp. (in: a-proteobacteria)]